MIMNGIIQTMMVVLLDIYCVSYVVLGPFCGLINGETEALRSQFPKLIRPGMHRALEHGPRPLRFVEPVLAPMILTAAAVGRGMLLRTQNRAAVCSRKFPQAC